jgi:hypothetical protein
MTGAAGARLPKRFLAALLLGLCTSCASDVHPIKTRALSQKNPTSYVFPHPVPEVREKVLTALEDYKFRRDFYSSLSPNNPSFHFSVNTRGDAGSSEPIFASPDNKDDLYLHSFGDWIDPSPVYFAGGKPLRYRAKFQLHLTALGDNSTKVSVITHDPSVINGSVCCGLHGYKSNDVAVEPTTIEEYRILLFIGRVLGVSDMPHLSLPEDK